MNNHFICQICNRREANSKEHLPPQSADNKGRLDIRFIRHDTSEGVQHTDKELGNGFWMKVQCIKCNNRLGRWYSPFFADFYKQIKDAPSLIDLKGKNQIYLREVYPARILKQMFSMFLSIQPTEPPPEFAGLRDFVYKKDALLPDHSPRVYLYKNVSDNSRFVPRCGILEFFTSRLPILISEISWSPVGLIFFEREVDNKDDRFEYMECINHWGKMSFKEKTNITVSLPELKVTSDHPIAFGTPDEVEQWRTKNGIAWAVAEVPNKQMETHTSLIIKGPK